MSFVKTISKPDELSEELGQEELYLVRRHLAEVIASHAFSGGKRAQDFLQLIVEHALAGEFDHLRERMIGAEMFGRPIGYDTANDSVVRVKATEVRKKLAQYYLETRETPPIRITLPSGSYVPRFTFEPLQPQAIAQTDPPPPIQLEAAAPESSETADQISEAKQSRPNWLNWRKLGGEPVSRQVILLLVLIGACLGLAVVAIAGYASYQRWHRASRARTAIRSIAVLPFENLSRDPQEEYFSDAMTEELTAELGQISAMRVISRTSAMSYKGTKRDLPEIAQELSVDGVVEGSVLRNGNQVRITARLIDARTDQPIWVKSYVRDLTDVLTLQGELAQAIAEQVSISVTAQTQENLSRVRPVNSKAEDFYMRGMMRIDANDPRGAMAFFQSSISADPNFAHAHAALADLYGKMGEIGVMPYSDAFSQQKTEAIKAIELDNSLPEGHAELANAAMDLDWDWSTAAKEFNRALELNPNSAPIHEHYSIYLERVGRTADAVAETDRGLELDPVGGRAAWDASYARYFDRQYDQALVMAQRSRNLNINAANGSFLLGVIYAQKGMYGKAIDEFQKLGDNSPHTLGHLGSAYALAGQTDLARKIISKLEANVKKNGLGAYEIALIYAALGENDNAFKWLETSFKEHSYGLMHLKIDPCLDPLRSDPRFNNLVSRVGLPL